MESLTFHKDRFRARWNRDPYEVTKAAFSSIVGLFGGALLVVWVVPVERLSWMDWAGLAGSLAMAIGFFLFLAEVLGSRLGRERAVPHPPLLWSTICLLLCAVLLIWALPADHVSWYQWPVAAIALLLLVSSVVHVADAFGLPLGMRRAAKNHLTIDDDGFAYTAFGVTRRWPWQALSAFRLKPSPASQRLINSLANLAWRPRRGAYAVALSTDADVCVIEDIYDTPLEEIAGKLNECRDVALGGARHAP